MPTHVIGNCRPDNNAVAQCDAFPKRSAEVRSKRLGADASKRYLFGALINRSQYDLERFIFAACEVNTWLLCSWRCVLRRLRNSSARSSCLLLLHHLVKFFMAPLSMYPSHHIPLRAQTARQVVFAITCWRLLKSLSKHDVRGGLLHILRASV